MKGKKNKGNQSTGSFFFSIQKKMVTTFLILILVFSLFALITVGSIARDTIEQKIDSHLESVVQSRSVHISTFLKDHKDVVLSFSTDHAFKDVLIVDNNHDEYNHILEEIYEKFESIFEVHKEFFKITIIDVNGSVVVSTYQSSLNVEKEEVIDFSECRNFNCKKLHFSDRFDLPYVDYGFPLIDDEGEILGGLIVYMDVTGLYEILTDETGLGKTGELYIVNNLGIMISPSRFYNDSYNFEHILFKQKINSTIFSNAMSMAENPDMHIGHDSISISKDYRGIDVIGTHIYVPEMEWILFAQMDLSEAHEPINTLQENMILIFIIITIFGTVFSFLISRSISKPIIDLKNVAQKIGEGRLDTKIQIKSHDEVGKLTKAFREMVWDLKLSREQIEEQNKNLERQVMERTKEITTQNKKLTANAKYLKIINKKLKVSQEELKGSVKTIEILLKQKDDFIHMLSHDLKNPLVPVNNLLPLIKERVDDTETSKYLDIVSESFDYIKRLIINTLKLARLNSPSLKLNTEKLDLSKITQDIISTNQTIFEEKNIQVENEIINKIYINADKLRFEELFNNLLSNAIKYIPDEKGKISIHAKEDKNLITISVKDTGIGLTKKQTNRIFDEFYKADESRHEQASTGLGLTICKQIVEKHGGHIWVESKGKGKGSTFYFTIPKN